MQRILPAMLYVPGGDERKLEKASTLEVDAVIFDLEDAVADAHKAEARAAVARLLGDWSGQAEAWVRINTTSPQRIFDDLEAVVGPRVSGIVLPKVETAEDVGRVSWLLSVLEARRDMAPGSLALLPTVETARGLANARAIAAADPRTLCLGFGAGDYSLDLGVDWLSEDGTVSAVVLAARTELVVASRLAGLQGPHDGAFPRYRDLDGLRREAAQASAIGMSGKHAIHPGQVPVIAAAFRPSEARLAQAREIVRQFRAQESAGRANVAVGAMFVDYPVARRAQQLLALADAPEEEAR